MGLTAEHRLNLAYAKSLLEKPSFASRIANALGAPIEKGFARLPERWTGLVQDAARRSIQRALDAALATMQDAPGGLSFDGLHRALALATGAAGGAFGLPALTIELPISTIVMLRSIADVARSEGESIRTLETKLACIEVFALGGRSGADDAAEAGYYAVRAALARAVSDAVRHVAERGIAGESAPALVRLISTVASRFGVVVSEKAAAQAIPLVGAAGGAVVNTLFIDHFQTVARGHFIVRRLERTYGPELVRRAYDEI